MTPHDYLNLKARMLVAAEAGGVIARATDTVRFDEEMYPVVMESLARLKADVLRLFAELDILRDQCGLTLFPPLHGESNASDDAPNDAGAVDALPSPTNEGSREEVPANHAEHGGDVPAGGADGERQEMPKPRRNRSGKKKTSGKLGRKHSSGSVDRKEG
jgi:hypothetical protein